MRILRLAFVLTLLALICTAMAEPPFWKLVQSHYHPSATSDMGVATCVTCHVAPGNTHRNPFGKELEKLIDASPEKTLTLAMLVASESGDADGDTFSNGDELKAGTLPGDPKSKPSAPPVKPAEAPGFNFFPGHSYHPLMVHFPIGLFIFGALVDFIGKLKRQPKAREAASYMLTAGAAFSVLAIITGLLAMYRMEKTLEGTLLYHLLLTVASSIFAIIVVLLRRKQMPDGAAYWIVLALATLAMSIGGHLGATMVWG